MNLQIHNPPWLITRTHYHDNDFEYGQNDHLKTRINGLI